MTMFKCACGTVDNTATAGIALLGAPSKLCTLCQGLPWHDEFPHRFYSYEVDGPVAPLQLLDSTYWGGIEPIPPLDINPAAEGGPEQERKAA